MKLCDISSVETKSQRCKTSSVDTESPRCKFENKTKRSASSTMKNQITYWIIKLIIKRQEKILII